MIRSEWRRRAAFTLIELLTVISIILVLVSMIVAVAYTGNNKQLTANASTTLVGWLKTAQAYALRDQKPYGVRLFNAGTGMITSAQYIEQPDPWMGPLASTLTAVPAATGSSFTITANAGTDFTGGFSNAAQYAVQPGDFLEMPGMSPTVNGTPIAVIQGVTNATTLQCSFMPPDTAALWTFTNQAGWRIIRQPRVMVGADLLSLPAGVAINLNTNNVYGSPIPQSGQQVDILFSPNGSVVTSRLPGRDIRLWLVDLTQNLNVDPNSGSFNAVTAPSTQTFQGEQFVVTIAVRTGLVSVQPIDVTPNGTGGYANPYNFAQDGKSSGY